jgi:hypothetical protein
MQEERHGKMETEVEWGFYKPRRPEDCQNLPKARGEKHQGESFQSLSKGASPAYTVVLYSLPCRM